MRTLVRSMAALGTVAVVVPLTGSMSHAAPVRAECISESEEQRFGRGEIALCPQSDGSTRVTGWTEDLLPGNGWTSGPDGACVVWNIDLADGTWASGSANCPHFGPNRPTTRTFDYVQRFRAPVTGATLTYFFA